MTYREILPTDNPNKGRYHGACNRRDCMTEDDVEYYNFGTGSYYCGNCAHLLNEANPDTFGVYGVDQVCEKLTPQEVVDHPKARHGQTLADLEPSE